MVEAVINWLYRTGLKKGTTGGHWSWYVVAAGAWLLRWDRGRVAEAPVRMPLQPGDTVVVTLRELDDAHDS